MIKLIISEALWLLLFCFFFSAPTSGTGCSDETYSYCATTDSCYKYYSTAFSATWQSAENRCVQDVGHLTTMHSQAEFDDCMESIIPEDGGQDSMVWIGLHPVDGNWAWTNSDPLSGFVNWKSGETPTMGKCVTALHKVCCSNSVTGYKGEWRTVRSCGNSNPYVCKLSTSLAATTTTTEATTTATTEVTTTAATTTVATTTTVETTTTDFMTTTKTPDCLNLTVTLNEALSKVNEKTCTAVPQNVTFVTPVMELTLLPECSSKIQNESVKLILKMSGVTSSCADLDFLFSWNDSSGCPRIKSCVNLMATSSSVTDCEVQCACPGAGCEMRILSHNCYIIGQQTNVDWNALVSNETNTDVRMYT